MTRHRTGHVAAVFAWAFALTFACGRALGDTAARPAGETSPVPARVEPAAPPRSSLGDQPLRPAASAGAGRGDDPMLATASKPNSMDYPRVAGALGVVIALIFVLRWCGKIFFPSVVGRGQGRAVEVLSRSVLAPKQQVLLLRVGRRLVVVGDSGAQMNTLCEISDPDEVAGLVGQLREEKVAAATAFGSLFGRFNRRFESGGEEPEEQAHSSAAGLLEDAPEEPQVESARSELDGLRERVRMLSEQFK